MMIDIGKVVKYSEGKSPSIQERMLGFSLVSKSLMALFQVAT